MYTPTKHVMERYIERVLGEDIEDFNYEDRGMDIVTSLNDMIFNHDYAYGSVKDNVGYFLTEGYCIVVDGVNISTIYKLHTDFDEDSEAHKLQVKLLIEAFKELDKKRLQAKVTGDIGTMYKMTDRLEDLKVVFLTPRGVGDREFNNKEECGE